MGLAAHRIGKADLAHADTDRSAQEMVRALSLAKDPKTRLEFARILDAGGARDKAMEQYAAVAAGLEGMASPSQIYEARLALTRYALSDTEAGSFNPASRYEDYRDPLKALADMYDKCFSLTQRAELTAEKARHLMAQGKKVEAVLLISPQLASPYFSDQARGELRKQVWDTVPEAMEYYRQLNEPLLAYQLYQAFKPYLAEHPRRDDIRLSSADALLGSDLNDQAGAILDEIENPAELTPEQRQRFERMKEEHHLYTVDAETAKDEARALLTPETDPLARYRVLRFLAGLYAGEGKHAYAAQYYLQGTNLQNEIPWRHLLQLYADAAREYEASSNYSKATEAYWRGIRSYEETGLPLSQAAGEVGDFLFGMGANFRRMGDAAKASKAFDQYLRTYPKGPRAQSARLLLAECYLDKKRTQDALSQYSQLTSESKSQPFWARMGAASATQLNWEEAHPYLSKGTTP